MLKESEYYWITFIKCNIHICMQFCGRLCYVFLHEVLHWIIMHSSRSHYQYQTNKPGRHWQWLWGQPPSSPWEQEPTRRYPSASPVICICSVRKTTLIYSQCWNENESQHSVSDLVSSLVQPGKFNLQATAPIVVHFAASHPAAVLHLLPAWCKMEQKLTLGWVEFTSMLRWWHLAHSRPASEPPTSLHCHWGWQSWW